MYLTILIPHTILAIVIVPLILITLSRALRERFDRHRAIARWTLPLWLYVSVTGVIVYWLLYIAYTPICPPAKPGSLERVEMQTLLVRNDGVAVLDLDVADVVGQLQLLAIFGRRHHFGDGRVERGLRQGQRTEFPATGSNFR